MFLKKMTAFQCLHTVTCPIITLHGKTLGSPPVDKIRESIASLLIGLDLAMANWFCK